MEKSLKQTTAVRNESGFFIIPTPFQYVFKVVGGAKWQEKGIKGIHIGK